MQALAQESIYSSFLERLSLAPIRVLLLDYDGTLAPFQTDRDHAFPYPTIPALLGRIIDLGTRVVLITGRPARELVLLSGIHPHPEIWGSHGMERLKPDGTYHVDKLPDNLETGLLQAVDVLRAAGLEDRMELKSGGVALHWRGLDAHQVLTSKETVQQLWAPLAREHGLRLLDFDGGVELRDPGKDKGKTVATILSETGPNAAIAYLGDDRTDEDAFSALKGRGLTVLVREQERPTAADIWLKPPKQLLQFLEDWLEATGEKP
jgi:trehalose 6-phosphate phosphatase